MHRGIHRQSFMKAFYLILALMLLQHNYSFVYHSHVSERRHHVLNVWGQPGLDVDILKNWIKVNGTPVLLPRPKEPIKAIVHFIGGFLVGKFSPLTYNDMLEYLGDRGYVIIATPIPLLTLKHGDASKHCSEKFNLVLHELQSSYLLQNLPVFGLAHSLGGKLTALISASEANRTGNVYLAFNNYEFQDSSSSVQKKEFTPSADQTWQIIENKYNVKRNRIIRFSLDPIDQSIELSRALDKCGGINRYRPYICMDNRVITIVGDHLQPNKRDDAFFEQLYNILEEMRNERSLSERNLDNS